MVKRRFSKGTTARVVRRRTSSGRMSGELDFIGDKGRILNYFEKGRFVSKATRDGIITVNGAQEALDEIRSKSKEMDNYFDAFSQAGEKIILKDLVKKFRRKNIAALKRRMTTLQGKTRSYRGVDVSATKRIIVTKGGILRAIDKLTGRFTKL